MYFISEGVAWREQELYVLPGEKSKETVINDQLGS